MKSRSQSVLIPTKLRIAQIEYEKSHGVFEPPQQTLLAPKNNHYITGEELLDQPVVILKRHLKKDEKIIPSDVVKTHAQMSGATEAGTTQKAIDKAAEAVIIKEKGDEHMLDEKDLQAIRELIQESEQRMNAKIEQSASQTLKEAMQGASVLMESYFEPKFNLLFENQQTMLETLAPKSRVEELEEEVAFLRSVIRQHSRDIEELKHA